MRTSRPYVFRNELTPSAFPPAPPQDSRAGQQGRAVPPTPAGVAAPAPARQRPPQRAPLRSVPLRSPAVPPPPLSAAPRPAGLPPFPSGSREAYRSRCPHTDTPTAAAPPSARRKRPPTPQPSAALLLGFCCIILKRSQGLKNNSV